MAPYSNNLYPLAKVNLVLLLIFLVIGGLYIAQSLLIPLAFAAIFAMLLIPLCQKLENKGMGRGWATFLCVILLVFFFLGLSSLLSAQIASFTDDLPKIEQQFRYQLSKFQQFIQSNFGLSPQQQEEAVKGEDGSGISSTVIGYIGSFTVILANSLLTLVYLFMLIYYRSHFYKFILKAVSVDQKDKARKITSDSTKIAQRYLVGRGILILLLGIMYSIGLAIVGVDNAVLLSLLAALVSIIPYIGNIIGVIFPLLMALAQGADFWIYMGILLVFTIVQFIESYILEPYVVGAEVNIHPFFTIVIIIVGEMIWGIAGMILAIPLLGILKIFMENIDPLKPYAFLIAESKKNSDSSAIKNKITNLFSS